MQRRTWLVMAVSLGTAIGLGACGSSSSSTSAEESKSVDQIFNDALNALNAVTQVHLSETATDSSGTSKIDAIITGDSGRATVTDATGAVTMLVFTGGAGYASQGGAFQALDPALTTQISSITIHNTVSCARKEHGGLTKGAISTVNGKRVIAITDDGKAPGASPGTVYIALDGPPLPVQIVQNGPSTAGGSPACGHSTPSTTKNQTANLDYPAGNVSITAPPVSSATDTGSSSSSTATSTDTGGSASSTSTETESSSSSSSETT